MAKILGIGGVFFKARDPDALRAWYRRVLDLAIDDWGGVFFTPDLAAAKPGAGTVWSAFKADTTYFAPSTKDFMINFMVDDLAAMLARLAAEGVKGVKALPDEGNGLFAHLLDPEGNKIELWEPKPMAAG